MKLTAWIASTALTLLLGGCATTIRSDVTTFQQWPAQLQDKSYAFDAPVAADDTLEYRSYLDLVRKELTALGFREAGAGTAAALKVTLRFTTTEQPVRVIQLQDPFLTTTWRYGWYRPYRYGYWGLRSPFYDPFLAPPVVTSDEVQNLYQRDVQIAIRAAGDGQRLFDVTVRNKSQNLSTPAMMPALVHSAFVDFPGPNGAARRVEIKQE